MRERMRVGAAQVAPAFLDKGGTIEKIARTLAEAGRLGLDLLVFPETFLAAYPFWRGAVSVRRETELTVEMQRQAVRIPSEDTDEIGELVRRANVNCVIGLNELDDRPGSLTMYNTLLVVARDGRLLGRHRKLIPTHSERVYWGMGDGRDIRVFDTDLGALGALVCYEHHVTLLRAALALAGEELHAAVWPGWWTMDGHLGAKRPEPGSHACDIEPAIRAHAIENSVFVVSSSWYLPPEAVPAELAEVMRYNLATGGSCIVNPSGLFTREPVFGAETIVWAEIDQTERRLAKAYFDSVGHYARWDLLQLVVREEGWEPKRAPEPSGASLRQASERWEVRLDRLERLVADLATRDPRDARG
ncbi:MAG: carbon-nitrogen hydrolase family protein [Candidatus Rokubacteria bacterium]|nr:carbon-nitrogen hydrolase family protein [Candidatus Rokubacteria bacterium]